MYSISKILLLTLLILAALSGKGQQEPHFTHNPFNHMGANPGFAGLSNAICATGITRQQWVGFRDYRDEERNRVAPETYLISVDATIPRLRGGIGAVVIQDNVGFYTINGIQLGYAYHHRMGEGRLGIGIQANFINTFLDAGKFLAVDETDPLLTNLSGEASNLIFDMNMGLYYQMPGEYYIGFSSNRLLERSKEFDNAAGAFVNFRRHYYLSAGMQYTLPGNPAYELIPSVMIKSDGASFQYDIHALMLYNQKVWGGLTYRYQDAIGLMVGVTFNDLRIGYSYDIPLSVVGAGGSHEVMINYCFKLELEQTRKSFRNTRFL